MEHSDLRGLARALGISSPWSISSVTASDSQFRLDIHLELDDKKRLFGLFSANKKEAGLDLAEGRWQYVNVGNYQCVVHAQVPAPVGDDPLHSSVLKQPGFLGHPAKRYSNYIRQQVALAKLKGMDVTTTAEMLRVDSALVDTVLADLAKGSSQARTIAHLPTDSDPVWAKVLLDQTHIRTASLPLKLLLSKLKLACSGRDETQSLYEWAVRLRDFFVANAVSLDDEIDQLCGIESERQKIKVREQKGRIKLVLPGLGNSVWLELVSGRINLNSQSVPLNLLLARQRSAFLAAANKDGKITALQTLREYFRKHHKSLRPELLLLNRAMGIKAKTVATLPAVESQIWQKILDNENLLPSENMAYRLLLAKLRSAVSERMDPVVRIDAAKKMREFMGRNKNVLRKELGLLLQYHKAG